MLYQKSLRVIIGASCIQQAASRDQAALGHSCLPHDLLPGIGFHVVRIYIRIDRYAVNLDHLYDAGGNDSVIVAALGQCVVIRDYALIGQQ